MRKSIFSKKCNCKPVWQTWRDWLKTAQEKWAIQSPQLSITAIKKA